MLFQVSYERFKKEIEIEKITEGDRNQLEIEDLGTMFAYYLNSLDRSQTYVFVVEKDEMTDIQKINLNPISRPSRRIIEDTQLKNISETLQRIEENLNKIPKQTIIEREIKVEE